MLGESQRLQELVGAVRAAAEARTLAELGGDAFRSLAVALDASPALMFEMGTGTKAPAPTVLAGDHAPLFPRYVTDFLEDDLPHNPAAFRHQPIRAPMQSEVYRRTRVYRDFYRANGITDKLHMLVAGDGSFEPGAVAVSLTRMGRQSDFSTGDVELARLAYPAFEASARRALRWGGGDAFLAALVDHAAPRPIVAVDSAGRLLWLSSRAERILEPVLGRRRALPERLVDAARRLGRFVTARDAEPAQPPVFRVAMPVETAARAAELSIARTAAGEAFVVIELEEDASPPQAAILRRRFGLTRAEADVLALLAVGLSNLELAHRLHVSLDTIKRHLYHVFRKLNVSSRVQAALRARNLL
jgi:DNA-binding CsgD family transcriptional regulator